MTLEELHTLTVYTFPRPVTHDEAFYGLMEAFRQEGYRGSILVTQRRALDDHPLRTAHDEDRESLFTYDLTAQLWDKTHNQGIVPRFFRAGPIGPGPMILGLRADYDGYDGVQFDAPGMSDVKDMDERQIHSIMTAREVIQSYFSTHPEAPERSNL